VLVGVIGNIGAGKSTAVNIFSGEIGGEPVFEPVVDNPYLKDFYGDMAGFSFPLQVYFLSHRLRTAVENPGGGDGLVWLDRTVLEDRDIFALNLRRSGLMAERDWDTYLHMFETMAPHFGTPDLFVYLKASVPTLMRRISGRGRDYESAIPESYLADLNDLYDEMVSNLRDQGCLVYDVDMDNTDLADPAQAAAAVASVRSLVGGMLVCREAAKKRPDIVPSRRWIPGMVLA
jgi:deoxyadenosine/deoxycytidine kinase